ncbi:MAG TPA: hypothetical protein VGR56_09835 [Nitrososphaerales archaeon]|nr:hypothetical protein [Nitrososphaerales archaeon]
MAPELASCVDRTLRAVLGDSPAEALLYYLEPTGKGSDPKALSKELHQLLGSGASMVEMIVVKSLYQAFGENFEGPRNLDFAASMSELVKIIDSRVTTGAKG